MISIRCAAGNVIDIDDPKGDPPEYEEEEEEEEEEKEAVPA